MKHPNPHPHTHPHPNPNTLTLTLTLTLTPTLTLTRLLEHLVKHLRARMPQLKRLNYSSSSPPSTRTIIL